MEILSDIIMYSFGALLVLCLCLEVLNSDSDQHKYGHHDGRPGSFYEISNRKDD